MSLSLLDLKIYGLGGRSCKTFPPPREWKHCLPAAPGSLRWLEFYGATSELQVNLQVPEEQKEHNKGEN